TRFSRDWSSDVCSSDLYFPNPSDLVQALDAATGDLIWEYRRRLPDDLGTYFPVPSINRNLAIYADTIIDTSADDYVFALDARTRSEERRVGREGKARGV